MIAKKSDELCEASEALYVMNADQMIREQSRAREDYYRIQNTINHKMEKLVSEKEKLTSEKEQLISEKEKLTSEKEQLISKNEELTSKYEKLMKLLHEYDIPFNDK